MARERFRVSCIRIRGLTTHRDTSLSLPPGSLALIGENGAGKTSILEALHLALTGKPLRAGRAPDIVSVGAPSAAVDVVLLGDRGTRARLRVVVPRARRGGPSHTLIVNGKVVATTSTAYKSELARLLGFHSYKEMEKLLEVVGIVKQGGLQAIAETMARPKDFREMLEKAVGIPEYREAVEKLAQVELSGDLDVEVGSWTLPSGGLSQTSLSRGKYVRLKRAIAETSDKLAEARRVLVDAERAAERARRDIDRLEEEIRTLEDEAEKLRDAPGLAAALRETVKRLKEEIRTLEREVSSLEAEKRKVEGLLHALAEEERIARLEGEAREAKRLQAEAESARQRLLLLDELIRQLEAVEKLRAEVESLEDVEREAERARRKLEEALSRQSQLSSRLSSILQAEAKVRRLLAAARRLYSQLPEDPREALEALRSEADRLLEEKERLEEEAAGLEAKAASLEREAEEARRALEALRVARKPECPVCGRPLDSEHRSRVERLLGEKAALAGEAASMRRRASSLRSQARLLGERARILSDHAARLEEAIEGYDPSEKERLRAELERIEEETSRLRREVERLEEQVRRLTRKRGALEKAERDAASLARKLGLPGTPGLDEARRLKLQAEESLSRLSSRLAELEELLTRETGEESIEDAIARVEEAAAKARDAPVLREKVANLERRIEEARRRIEEDRARLEEAEARLVDALERLGRLAELDDKIEKLREQLSEAKRRLTRAELMAERALQDLEEGRRRLEALSKVRRRMEAAMVAGRILSDIQEALARHAVVALQNGMNAVLSRFNLDYVSVDLRLDQSGGIRVEAYSRSRGTSVPVNLLSGGEKSAIALAYVLGLQRILSAGIGFLALDEPTSDLDQERRLVLLDVLGSAVGQESVDQLIVVTHHQEIIDKVDRVCVVEKRNGVSRLVDPDGGECPKCSW